MAKKDISAVNGPKTRTTINHTQLPDELMATYDLKREGIRQMRSMQTTKDVGGTDGDLLIRVKTSPMYKTQVNMVLASTVMLTRKFSKDLQADHMTFSQGACVVVLRLYSLS
jgi:hypothetical protein